MTNDNDTIDSYIAGFPSSVQDKLTAMRASISKAAPDAAEKMSYGVPTFTFNGNLVHFAAYERHIGFYPGPSAIAAFSDELAPFKRAKGSVQFPLDQPLPLDLVGRMVSFRLAEQMGKTRGR